MSEWVRKAVRGGLSGTGDRLLQVARVRAERRAAGRPIPEVWDHLADADPALRQARTAGDAEQAEQLLLDAAQSRRHILSALTDLAATMQAARQRFPTGVTTATATADRALAHRFTLFGWMEVDAGAEVDWLREPATGIVSPPDFWADIDLEGAAVGNLRVLWELNRHQHLLDLARTYCFTLDRRYADEIAAHCGSWIAQNPCGLGANWASSLEVALRAVSWLWARSLLLSSNGLGGRFNAQLLGALRASGDHIARHLSYTYSPNTHLLGEALGLVYIGAMAPELRAAPAWFALGRRILVREAGHQFLADGFHFEHSTWYHRFASELYLHAAILCERAGAPLPASTLQVVRRALDSLAALGARTNETALIGDDDGGQNLPLAHTPPADFRDTMALGAAFFRSGDLKPEGEDPAEAVLWALGGDGLAAYDALKASTGVESRYLPSAGIAAMRSPEGAALTFDCGDHAAPDSAHGHAGALAIQVRTPGGPVLVDPGTCSYADPEWRAYFRGTSAHNTLVVDGEDQSRAGGPFAWADTGEVHCRAWVSEPDFDFAEAEYRWPSGIAHLRRVLYVKPRYWIVMDLVTGTGRHSLEQWFHFPPCQAALDGENRCQADTPGGRFWIVPAIAGCEAGLVEGEAAPPQGWVSDVFGRKQSAPALCYRISATLPAVMIALIVPAAGDLPPAISRLEQTADFPQAVGLQVTLAGETDFILLAPPDGRKRTFGPFASDARAAVRR
jgi:hypothetical protein